jgi:hypothetical protein
MNMVDAMMNRPLIASRKTVLRHRQRNSTHKERSHQALSPSGWSSPKRLRLHSPTRAMKTERKSFFLTQIIGWLPFS